MKHPPQKNLWKFLKSHRSYIFTTIALIISLVILAKIYNTFIYTFGFTDEGDNISIGNYVLMGKGLYKDIFSQHQPLTYYFSAALQGISQPDNLLLVVRRHRQAIMIFSYLWIIFITFRFSKLFLPFAVILELTKYYFIGHLFLAESLVIYPLIYLFLTTWQLAHGKKLYRKEAVLIPFCIFFIAFNLLPLWPLLAVLFVLLLFYNRKNRYILLLLTIPLIVLTGLLFIFVPLTYYIDATIYANIFYYIPSSNEIAFQVETSPLQMFLSAAFFPFLTFILQSNPLILIYRLLAVFWIISAVLYVRITKKWWIVLAILFMLYLSNQRPMIGSNIYYHAFHALPHFSLFIASIVGFLVVIVKQGPYRFKQLIFIPLILIFVFLGMYRGMYYFEKHSEADTAFINFSELFTYGQAIKLLSNPTDTLAVLPYEELLYWYPKLNPPTRFLFYLAWVNGVPSYHKEIQEGLTRNPPAFVFNRGSILEPNLVTSDYISVPKDATSSSNLFIRKDKFSSITEDQWKRVETYGFHKEYKAKEN